MRIPVKSPDGFIIDYDIGSYQPGNGWFDFKKKLDGADDKLCFMAVASNALQWWMGVNRQYIDRYIAAAPTNPLNVYLKEVLEGPCEQHNSALWNHFLKKFSGRTEGYAPDYLEDNFINGYPYRQDGLAENNENTDGTLLLENGPDNSGNGARDIRCGFFYDVFKAHRLSDRVPSFDFQKTSFGETVRKGLLEGKQIDITFSVSATSYATHVVSMWGAEFNEDNTINAVFICDNNDVPGSSSIKRMLVAERNDLVYLTAREDRLGDVNNITNINLLDPGTEYWERYFKI